MSALALLDPAQARPDNEVRFQVERSPSERSAEWVSAVRVVRRALRMVICLLVTLWLCCVAATVTTTASAAASSCDAQTTTCADDHGVDSVGKFATDFCDAGGRTALWPAETERMPTTPSGAVVATNIAPSEIRLSQATVNGPRTSALADDMAARGWQGDPVDVVRMPDGGLTTLDNKRVVAANDVGIDVSARIHDFDAALPADRLGPKSPGTWGGAITERIANQKPGWRNCYPIGAPFTCRMGD